MDEIIMGWMEQQRKHRNDDGTIFFQVSFRDLFEEWHEFVQGKYEQPIRHMNIIAAEDAACTNSIHRLNTLTKVHMGLIVLSLWSDGVCLYRNPISEEYIGQDYSDVWRDMRPRKKR